MRKQSIISPRNLYLWLVSGIGIVLVVWGLILLPRQQSLLIFLLLIGLAIAAQITATSLIEGNVTVEVGTAVSMATIALYTPVTATIVAAASLITVTLINFHGDWKEWRGVVERISFNMGMSATAIFLAGTVFQFILSVFGSNFIISVMLAWLVSAIVNDQVNLWLLIGMIHLQNGVKPSEIWKQHRWAIPINVVVMSVGGGVLAFAVRAFDIAGIGIFFLPIILSAYSFRLYVNQTRKQMENLEELVAERTSDLAKANGDLAQANKDLAALSKEKDAFLAVLTHDMRTPLTSIKGYSSILRDRDLDRPQQIHVAGIILRSQDTLLEIVNNILEIEKLQSGTPLLLERSIFDLAMLTQVVAETLLAPASEKQITLHYEELPAPIMVDGDRQKIKRVVTNLISNAVKYTPDNGDVWIKTWMNGRYAHVEVKDNGYGIPADELPHIFDRYSRVKGHRSLAVGTGLGLAIVKSLVEAHEGTIDVESEVNAGSTFTLKLPVIPADDPVYQLE